MIDHDIEDHHGGLAHDLERLSRHTASIRNYASVSLASDNVFGDNTSAQLAAMTPAMRGSFSAGYTATATIGLD